MIFYIDTENVQADWLKLIPYIKQRDIVHLFISENTCMAARSVSGCDARVIIHMCDSGSKNAMDFCIASVAGTQVAFYPDAEHWFVSKDLGFEACVHALSEWCDSIGRLSPTGLVKRFQRRQSG